MSETRESTFQMVSSGDMSASINSNGMDLQELDKYSIQAVYSGSPNGTLKLQISNDLVSRGPDSNPAANVVNWSDYTYSSLNISAAGSFIWKLPRKGEKWVRLVYTRSSGSGTLNVVFSGM